jgi:hypothetical protein
MYCKTSGYQAHESCCEGCIGHTTEGYCVCKEPLATQNDEQPVDGFVTANGLFGVLGCDVGRLVSVQVR